MRSKCNKGVYILDKNMAVNSISYFRIPAYNNKRDYQNTHPSVLYFNNHWNSYKYWMAVTPYENENENLENPCILCSNDGIKWVEPKYNINPLARTINKRLYHYSDTHLVFSENQLELWYRKRTRRLPPQNKEIIIRQCSRDGKKWGGKEILKVSDQKGVTNLLSPCVIYDEGKYKIWVSNFDKRKLEYYESNYGNKWEKVRDINISPFENDKYVWHMDIRKTENGYEMYYCAGSSYLCDCMCYSYSKDNIVWSDPVCVMRGSPGNFDEKIYRPSFVDIEGNLRAIYYGGLKKVDEESFWYIGLTFCETEKPTILSGYNFV